MNQTTNPYRPFDRFIFRSPLFSFSDFIRRLEELAGSAESFRTLFASGVVQEAIYLASPVLFEELNKYLKHGLPTEKEEEKLRYSAMRYFGRMSTRPTPFGLFAGCSIGHLGDQTCVSLAGLQAHKRRTRLDMSYLCALSQDLGRSTEARVRLRYFGNTSAYKVADKIRYVEYFYRGTKRIHQLSAVDYSEYLDRVLQEASQGKRISELAASLVDEEVAMEEALAFVVELADSQLIVNEAEPTVTGSEFLEQAIQHLDGLCIDSKDNSDVPKKLVVLRNIATLLGEMDRAALGETFPYYTAVRAEVEKLPTAYEPKHLFQTDMIKSVNTAILGRPVIESLLKCLGFLNNISPQAGETTLSKFRDAFRARYEDREMPLLRVLDNETGIGYNQGTGSGDINPLIDDLSMPRKNSNTTTVAWTNIQSVLLRKYIEAFAAKRQTIELTDDDFGFRNVQWDDLPLTISVMFKLLKDDESGHEILLKSVGGSSAVNLLGRFCHADQQIEEHVLAITAKEAELNPDVVFAEIAHLPESRIGNILLRPVLRTYEIPYLAKPGVSPEYQIPLSDLTVSVRNQKVRLWSKRLNKEVVPRLGSAHNFRSNAMPVYRFLCDMQLQDIRPGLAFSWGGIAGEHDWLPRVTYGNVILSAARWTIRKAEIKHFFDAIDDVSLMEAVCVWREKFNIPTYVVLEEGDNDLFVDFENVLSTRTLLSVVKKKASFVLEEFLFKPDAGPVQGPEGIFTNEFIVSFYKDILKR